MLYVREFVDAGKRKQQVTAENCAKKSFESNVYWTVHHYNS